MPDKESIFQQDDIDRLVEIMKERGEVDEAQVRTNLSRKKLVAAVEAEEPQETIEQLMQECTAASDAEMRLAIRSMQNRVWMRKMKKRIEQERPELHAAAEAMIGA